LLKSKHILLSLHLLYSILRPQHSGRIVQFSIIILVQFNDEYFSLYKLANFNYTHVSVSAATARPAPIGRGAVVGTVTLTIQGEVIGTADLIAGSDVSRNQVLYTLSRVSLFFSSTYFKVVIALTIFVVGCYGIYIAGRVLLASRKTR